MKNIIFAAILIIFIALANIKAAEPLVPIPEKPTAGELEIYEGSKEMFALKLIEFYKTSVIIHTQIRLLGASPIKDVPVPTMDDLESQDKKILMKYFNIIEELNKQLAALPLDPCKERVDSLRKLLLNLTRENLKLDNDNFETKLNNEHTDFYRKEFRRMLSEYDKLIVEMDNLKIEHIREMKEMRNNLLKFYENEFAADEPLISTSFTGNIFFSSGGGNIDNRPSPGFQVILNTYSLFGWWKGLEVWYEYVTPRLSVTSNYQYYPDNFKSYDWNTNLHSCGFSKKFGTLLSSGYIKDGIRIGLGYFWYDGNVYNATGSLNYKGGILNLEYFAGAVSISCPVELFLGLSVYHSFSKDLVYYENLELNPVNAGRTQLNAKLGLRFHFNKFPF